MAQQRTWKYQSVLNVESVNGVAHHFIIPVVQGLKPSNRKIK